MSNIECKVYQKISFEKALFDVTGGQPKVQKRNYLAQGQYPVIDQGQDYISGYIDDENLIYDGDLPVILFGDHTRIFKFVEKSFALGADGIKVLKASKAFESKFLYYFLQSINIPSKGYSRHFKFLKEIFIPLFPLSEQHRIVEILDQADALRKLRAEANAKAERILPALFYRMFGDHKPYFKLDRKKISSLIEHIERRNPSDKPDDYFLYVDISGVDGKFGRIVDVKKIIGSEAPSRARQVIKFNDVLISTVRPYLKGTALVSPNLNDQICSTGFCVLRSKNNFGYGYLYAISRQDWFTNIINSKARGASYPAVTDKDIYNIEIPFPENDEVLRKFDQKVDFYFYLQDNIIASEDKLVSLFSKLLQIAFSGKLTASWREAHLKELLVEMQQQQKYLNEKIK